MGKILTILIIAFCSLNINAQVSFLPPLILSPEALLLLMQILMGMALLILPLLVIGQIPHHYCLVMDLEDFLYRRILKIKQRRP